LPTNIECEEGLNFVFIADEAFVLEEHILKPYPQKKLVYEKRIYNYRLARARNVVENAFGLIANRFRILLTSINLNTYNINYIVLAICTIHNFLMKNSSSYIKQTSFDSENVETHEIDPGTWRQEINNINETIASLQTNSVKNSSTISKINRDEYLKFFNEKGKISWQDEMIRRGKA